MFTPSLQPATKQICGKNRGLLPLAYTTTERAAKNPIHSTQHSLFSRADKKYHSGAIVAAPSFDAELHIETTTIMFADVFWSMGLLAKSTKRNDDLRKQTFTFVVSFNPQLHLRDALIVAAVTDRHAILSTTELTKEFV